MLVLIGTACALIVCAAAGSGSTAFDSSMRRPSLAAARGITWLIFVDDLHVDFLNTGHFRNLIKVIAGELIDEDDVFMVRSSGPSNVTIDLTSDRARLVAAAKRASGNGLRHRDIFEPSEVRFRAAVAFAAAKGMLEALDAVYGGPAALIYVSNGYHLDVAPRPDPVMETTRFSAPARSISASRLRDQFWDLTGAARRANVRIFAIDPRTLPGAPKEDYQDPGRGRNTGPQRKAR